MSVFELSFWKASEITNKSYLVFNVCSWWRTHFYSDRSRFPTPILITHWMSTAVYWIERVWSFLCRMSFNTDWMYYKSSTSKALGVRRSTEERRRKVFNINTMDIFLGAHAEDSSLVYWRRVALKWLEPSSMEKVKNNIGETRKKLITRGRRTRCHLSYVCLLRACVCFCII